MTTKALLLAGGLGTRLRPITETVPKCLVPVAGVPMLDRWVAALAAAGIPAALINTHHHADRVRDRIAGLNATSGVKLVETHEPELLGSAGTIAANRDWADGADTMLVIYADNLTDADLSAFLDFHGTHPDPFTMMLFHAPDPRACGIATLDDAGRITGFTEKPTDPPSDLANAGIYAMDAGLWREIAGWRAFDMGFDVLPRLTGRMRGWTHDGYFRDIGTHAALAAADRDWAGR